MSETQDFIKGHEACYQVSRGGLFTNFQFSRSVIIAGNIGGVWRLLEVCCLQTGAGEVLIARLYKYRRSDND